MQQRIVTNVETSLEQMRLDLIVNRFAETLNPSEIVTVTGRVVYCDGSKELFLTLVALLNYRQFL